MSSESVYFTSSILHKTDFHAFEDSMKSKIKITTIAILKKYFVEFLFTIRKKYLYNTQVTRNSQRNCYSISYVFFFSIYFL